jgi:hypothetical protein
MRIDGAEYNCGQPGRTNVQDCHDAPIIASTRGIAPIDHFTGSWLLRMAMGGWDWPPNWPNKSHAENGTSLTQLPLACRRRDQACRRRDQLR